MDFAQASDKEFFARLGLWSTLALINGVLFAVGSAMLFTPSRGAFFAQQLVTFFAFFGVVASAIPFASSYTIFKQTRLLGAYSGDDPRICCGFARKIEFSYLYLRGAEILASLTVLAIVLTIMLSSPITGR